MNPTSTTSPWSQAVRREGAERERFLGDHLELVRYVALHIVARLPASVDVDDLIHDGVLGLIEAVERFEPERGVQFRTYAERRVQGAILDGLRRRDWQPRAVRRGQRELARVLGQLTATHGREVSDEELAEAMGVSLERLQALVRDSASGPILPLDVLAPEAHPPATPTHDPHAVVERAELLRVLAEELVALPQKQRQVLELYYHEELNMKEIGAVLGVTESRVSQLHGQAAARLRAALSERLRPRAAEGVR